MTAPAGVWRQGEEDPGRPARVPVSSYLIETESERILVDTGLNPGAVADRVGHYSESIAIFELEQEESIADQVDLGSLTQVVLTHLHFDHAGGLALVPESVPIVIQRAEWEAGHDDAGVELNFFQPRDYAGQDREVILVDGDHDLLGDGSIELLQHPGPQHRPPVGAGRRARDRGRRRPLRRRPRRPPLPGVRRRLRRPAPLGRAPARAPRRRPHASSPATTPR